MMDLIKKKAEIRRSKEIIEERKERGDDMGRPPYGLRYDEAGRNWVPNRESGEFDDALAVIEAREAGSS